MTQIYKRDLSFYWPFSKHTYEEVYSNVRAARAMDTSAFKVLVSGKNSLSTESVATISELLTL